MVTIIAQILRYGVSALLLYISLRSQLNPREREGENETTQQWYNDKEVSPEGFVNINLVIQCEGSMELITIFIVKSLNS